MLCGLRRCGSCARPCGSRCSRKAEGQRRGRVAQACRWLI